jgi:phosphoglycerate dehydrogenase-like enzyme
MANKVERRELVVLDVLSPASQTRFRALLPEGFTLTLATERSERHLHTIIAGADYAITGQVAVTGATLRAAHRLRLLHKWGVGVDSIDLDAAKELGIAVARTTGANAIPVAEYTIALMLSTLRHLAWAHESMRAGQWPGGRLAHDAFMLNGRTVGLVGCGAIGQRVAGLLKAFGTRTLYNQRHPLPQEVERELGIEYCSLDQLLERSEVISLHCPLTADTRGLINRAAFQRMKSTAILVNVSRGGVVNEQDLCWALANRVILAAASDVFAVEPLPEDSPLRKLDNLVLSPHLAAATADNFAPTVERMFANIARIERGEPIPELDLVVAPGAARG